MNNKINIIYSTIEDSNERWWIGIEKYNMFIRFYELYYYAVLYYKRKKHDD